MIDWNHPELRPAPRAARPNARESFYRALCPTCGRERWLTANNARWAEARGASCGICQRRAAGKVTKDRYGLEYFLKRVQSSQLANPSKPEAQVARWLKKLGFEVERQHIFITHHAGREQGWCIDFIFPTLPTRPALEVVGYWHKRERSQRDALLAELWGEVLFLDADLVTRQPSLAQVQIRDFLHANTTV